MSFPYNPEVASFCALRRIICRALTLDKIGKGAQIRQHGRGKAYRSILLHWNALVTHLFRGGIMIGKIDAHGRNGIEDRVARMGSLGVEHAGPEIDADGVVAAAGARGIGAVLARRPRARARDRSRRRERIRPNPWHSRGGSSAREGGECPARSAARGRRDRRAASRSKEKDGQIAGIQRPVVAVLEAGGAGHEHGAEAGQIRRLRFWRSSASMARPRLVSALDFQRRPASRSV